MKLNLKTQIETDINLIMKDFIDLHGWILIDSQMIAKDLPINQFKFELIIYPRVLHYMDKDVNQSQIWYACQLIVAKTKIDIVLNFLKNGFCDLKYAPFKDEDALHNYFVPYKKLKTSFLNKIKERYLMDYFPKNYVTTAFFLNPDYPKGYWCNHTIDSIKL